MYNDYLYVRFKESNGYLRRQSGRIREYSYIAKQIDYALTEKTWRILSSTLKYSESV